MLASSESPQSYWRDECEETTTITTDSDSYC